MFKDLLWIYFHTLNHFIDIKQKKKSKKTLNWLKIKTIYIYIYIYIYIPFSRKEFFNNSVAPDLLMLWIIRQLSKFLTMRIGISLIWTLNIVKSWQPLHTESSNSNKRILKNQHWQIVHSLLLLLLARSIPSLISFLS